MHTVKSLRILSLRVFSGIPTFAMLTKVDVLQQDVQNDVKNVYRSTEVRGLVSRTSEMLLDLPVHKVLPVVNYRDQIETNHDIDVLLMQSFSQLIEGKSTGKLCCFKFWK